MTARIECVRNSSADEGDDSDTLFIWEQMTCDTLEEINGFASILVTLASKIKTVIEINRECVSDSGSFHIEMTIEALSFYAYNERFRQRSYPICATIGNLLTDLQSLKKYLDLWELPQILIVASRVLEKIDIIYLSCRLYLHFLRPELLLLQKNGEREPSRDAFDRVSASIRNTNSFLRNMCL